MRRLDLLELFGDGARELLEQRWRLVRMPVNGLVRGGVGEAKVGRCVDDDELDAGARRGLQKLIDEARRRAMRGSR